MFKRDWIKYAAFGLGLAILLAIVSYVIWKPYSDYKTKNADSREIAAQHDIASAHKPVEFRCATTGKAVTVCYIQTPETEGASKYTEYDLEAQQDMAEWALLMVLLSIFGLVVSSVGIAFVAANLRQADRAIRSSEGNARDQNRAYLNAASADLLWGDWEGTKPAIVLGIQNSGQTPAVGIEIASRIFITDAEKESTDRLNFSDVELHGAMKRRAVAMPGNGFVLPFECSDESERATLTNVYGELRVINVAGVISYETIFNEIVETQFWFILARKHHYKTKPVRRPSLGGTPQKPKFTMVSTWINEPEAPQALKLVASDAVAYKIIGKVKY